MSRRMRFLPVVAVGFVLAACGQDAGSNPLAPPGPRMNSGYGTGGNYTGGGTTTTSTTSGSGGTVIVSDTTTRSGYGTGGN